MTVARWSVHFSKSAECGAAEAMPSSCTRLLLLLLGLGLLGPGAAQFCKLPRDRHPV